MRLRLTSMLLVLLGLPAAGRAADCAQRAAALQARLDAAAAQAGARTGLKAALAGVAAWRRDCPRHPAAPGLLRRAGLLAYERGRFDRAVSLLDALVTGWPDRPEAVRAARLVLDSLNLQRDFAAMTPVVERYLATNAQLGRNSPRLRRELERIAMQLAFKRAEQLSRRDPATAAARYLELVQRFPAGARAAESLYNAALLLEQAGQPTRARTCRQRLATEYPDSPLVERAEQQPKTESPAANAP